MFILFGSPRSGTTLLASALHQNDQIVIPDETDFIIPTAFLVDRIKDPSVGKPMVTQLILSADRTRRSLGEYLTHSDITAAIDAADYTACALIRSIYDALARKLHKTIAGDKSPNDLLFARILMKLGLLDDEQIKLIHIVRDVRDVVLSLQTMDWNLTDVAAWFPRLWSSSNLYIHDLFRSHPQRYRLIRYEDLVLDPQPQLRQLCDFLNVAFQPNMLDHATRGPRYANVDAHRNLSQPFLPSRAQAWQTPGRLDPALRAHIQKTAHEGLETFGYPL
jgi:hypothetical protein